MCSLCCTTHISVGAQMCGFSPSFSSFNRQGAWGVILHKYLCTCKALKREGSRGCAFTRKPVVVLHVVNSLRVEPRSLGPRA